MTNRESSRRRGVIVVKAAFLAIVLLGCTALAVDMGAIYNAKAELQRTADAAALAATAALVASGDADPLALARSRAAEYASSNRVWGKPMVLDPMTDVTFGQATLNAQNGSYDFSQTEQMPDAVRVRVRKTADSPNGAFGLFFAVVLGVGEIDLSATATAMMVPRDIALVADLSESHNDDSELRHYKTTQINLHQVWDDFPGGIDDSPGEWQDYPQYGPDDPQAAGPGWGYMKDMGYGIDPIDGSYDPRLDDGLVALPPGFASWTDPLVNDYLGRFAGSGYSPEEIVAINKPMSGDWEARVAVALGLARWDSGISYDPSVPLEDRGLWEKLGIDQAQAGNDDQKVTSDELTWIETIGERSVAESRGIWMDYIYNYMRLSGNRMQQANSHFRFRFGVKTFINYLMEMRPTHQDTPELADTRAQPMRAVKDAVQHLASLLDTLGTNDQVSLEIYGFTARHEMDLTQDFLAISDHLTAMQAGHYDAHTNMGGGITRAIEELTSSRARSTARKVMFLLTDGYANVTEAGVAGEPPPAGAAVYAKKMAGLASDLGVRMFCVSVGSHCDLDLMTYIAEKISNGKHFHASGSIDDYSQELDEILLTLGGLREVQLID